MVASYQRARVDNSVCFNHAYISILLSILYLTRLKTRVRYGGVETLVSISYTTPYSDSSLPILLSVLPSLKVIALCNLKNNSTIRNTILHLTHVTVRQGHTTLHIYPAYSVYKN